MSWILFLALGSLQASPLADWVERAMHNPAGPPWIARVELRHGNPPRLDTAQACRDLRGEQLLLPDGRIRWETPKEEAFLDPSHKEVRLRPSRFSQPPMDFPLRPEPRKEGVDTVAGRITQVLLMTSPDGRQRRLWIDSALGTILRSQSLSAGNSRHERRILTLRTGTGCPSDAFTVPSGWAVKKEPARPEGGPHHPPRRNVVANVATAIEVAGFAPFVPITLPPGWLPNDWAWIQGPAGPGIQRTYQNGNLRLSIITHKAWDGPHPCEEPDAPCPLRPGEAIAWRSAGDLEVLAIGDLPREDLNRILSSLMTVQH